MGGQGFQGGPETRIIKHLKSLTSVVPLSPVICDVNCTTLIMSHSFHNCEYKGNVSDTAIFDVVKVNTTVDLKSFRH